MADRQAIAKLIQRLARHAEAQAEYLAENTDYWESGGSPMEGHYELLDEAEATVKELTEL